MRSASILELGDKCTKVTNWIEVLQDMNTKINQGIFFMINSH